jgi:hypothetical protein
VLGLQAELRFGVIEVFDGSPLEQHT